MFDRRLAQYWEAGMQRLLRKNLSEKLWLEKMQHALRREMRPQRDAEKDRCFIPNCYVLHVCAADAEGRDLEALRAQLYVYLVQSAMQRGFYSHERLRLELRPNPLLRKGAVRSQAAYGQKLYDRAGAAQADGRTVVFDRKALPLAQACTRALTFAALQVLSGARAGACLPLGERRVQIGRKESSELCVPDAGISRLHAYIAFEGCRHVLYDADSLNGTYVNGARISCRALSPEDRVRVGATELLYTLQGALHKGEMER